MVIEIEIIGCCPAAIRLKKLILEVLLEELYLEITDILIFLFFFFFFHIHRRPKCISIFSNEHSVLQDFLIVLLLFCADI